MYIYLQGKTVLFSSAIQYRHCLTVMMQHLDANMVHHPGHQPA